ncbi:MAG: VCBS repeat-containing protein [Bacteroidales bacterium]|nr:VCBS repeat-containing protein [Bacteroidales bacterium]
MRNYLLLVLSLLLVSCKEGPRFELLDPEQTGITFNNVVLESDSVHVLNFEYIYNGAGVGIIDLNNDGLQDIIFTANQVAPRIYLNRGEMKFEDISDSFRDLDNGQWYSGITFTDINNDGWKDIYLTSTAHPEAERRKNRFYINQGPQEDGRLLFIDRAEAYGLADESYSVHAAFLDYDNDGDLDLYLLNNFVTERLSASYRAKINDGSAVSNDDFYRNNGDGTFTNVTIEAGIVYEGFGLGLAVGDVNKDGYPDVYVSNDYISNDLLYINQQDGTFKNEIATLLSYQTKSSMGNDIADINNDGYPDIFTLDMMPEYYYKKKQTINGFGYIYYINDEKYGYERQYLRNMMHLHNGKIDEEMVPYSEVGQMMGIYHSEWSWSPLFADYDNDGDKDLFIANGYPRDMTDKDWTRYKAAVFGSIADHKHVIERCPPSKMNNYAFENVGAYTFRDNKPGWFEPIESYSYGAAFADLDNDGDLDYVTNNLNDVAFVYKNNTVEKGKKEANFLRICLKGDTLNPEAFGAKVELWSGDSYQFQEHFLSRGYISSVDPEVHFGLSNRTLIDSVRVTWPTSGLVSVLKQLPSNQVVEIAIESAIAPREPSEDQDQGSRLFSRMNGAISYKHEQNDVIDYYFMQNIIPHKFSQIGPRIQQGDLDGDGLEDLIIGATNLTPTRVYLKQGDKYVQTEMAGLTTRKDFSESDFAILDLNGDGQNEIVALAGGYENRTEEYIHYLYEKKGDRYIRTPLPIPPFPASVVRVLDFDHDGDLDLFIGARIQMTRFPFAEDSWLLINQEGRFSPENCRKLDLGMVTDALWSDYDGDGWEDLLVAREWNSSLFLKNMEGESLVSQEIAVMEQMHGMWFSVGTGDFDQDGDPDYILGNLGENHRFTISEAYPLRIYAFDLDMNGTLDPISTAYWKDRNDEMIEYPINYLDELVGQSNFFLKQYKSYKEFSFASIPEMFDTATMNRVDEIFYINTASNYILWNEEETFRWEKLPVAAQVGPIKKTIIRDFNGDSYPDILIAGNDHTFDISTGYYDAIKGLLYMSSDGKALNRLVSPSESGIVLHGMVESLLYLDGESPLIIAGINRDSVLSYSVNR